MDQMHSSAKEKVLQQIMELMDQMEADKLKGPAKTEVEIEVKPEAGETPLPESAPSEEPTEEKPEEGEDEAAVAELMRMYEQMQQEA